MTTKNKMAGSCPSCKRQLRFSSGVPVCDGECAEGRRSTRVRNVLFRAMSKGVSA